MFNIKIEINDVTHNFTCYLYFYETVFLKLTTLSIQTRPSSPVFLLIFFFLKFEETFLILCNCFCF